MIYNSIKKEVTRLVQDGKTPTVLTISTEGLIHLLDQIGFGNEDFVITGNPNSYIHIKTINIKPLESNLTIEIDDGVDEYKLR